jgi:type VI secretion system secreted protein Hcp
MAAIDIFLKLDGIDGESLDRKHKGEIELSSFSFGLASAGSHALGSGAAAGKVSFQEFHFTSNVTKASPKLMLACATGQHIKEGTVTVRKAGGDAENAPTEFLFYKFQTVVITSVQDAGDNTDTPKENVSLAFAKVLVEYKPQNPDGTLGAAVDFAWDLAANKKV